MAGATACTQRKALVRLTASERLVPQLQRHAQRGLALDERARVVDQHVDRPERSRGHRHHARHVVGAGDIGLHGDGASTRRLDQFDGLLGAGVVCVVVDRYGGAAPRERQRRGLANAAAGAGDQGHPAHCRYLLV
jgi:hypothetical protein